jgi:PAS domain S-box-containing protein
MLSLHGRLLQTNPALQTLLRHTADEMRQLNLLDVLPAAEHDRARAILAGLPDSDSLSHKTVMRFVRNDGKQLTTRCVFALVKRKDGKPQFLLLQIDDITTRQAQRWTRARRRGNVTPT